MTDSKGAAIEKLTKHMVDRFLAWKLPEDFQPDNGISFKPTYNGLNGPMKCYPVGTNLFTATQATEMVKYMLDDAILAILAQEVKRKTILELKRLQAYGLNHEITTSIIEDRIKAIERLG